MDKVVNSENKNIKGHTTNYSGQAGITDQADNTGSGFNLLDFIKEKKKLIVGVLFLLLLIWGGSSIIKGRAGSGNITPTPSPTPFLPPADPNIVVTLVPKDRGKTVELTISNYADNMLSIEYELTYKANNKTEGVFGTIKIDKGMTTINRELTLGTCSSGVCRYHSLDDGKGILTIKFTSTVGATRFQKEFQLI